VDAVYPSQRNLQHYLAGLSARARQLVADRLFYMGNAVSMQNMADMYRICDVYVSPYRAEGFNMPVLEAAACGLPVICTAGGPTDEFISDRFARRIESTIEEQDCEGVTGQCVNPNLDALIDLMVQAVDDEDWRARSASEGPRHVAENYTWDRVVNSLLQQLMQ
jgi:glycosyltransferase involved in cell wall biosynthesis